MTDEELREMARQLRGHDEAFIAGFIAGYRRAERQAEYDADETRWEDDES